MSRCPCCECCEPEITLSDWQRQRIAHLRRNVEHSQGMKRLMATLERLRDAGADIEITVDEHRTMEPDSAVVATYRGNINIRVIHEGRTYFNYGYDLRDAETMEVSEA